MVLRAQDEAAKAGRPQESYAPPMVQWSPEAERLDEIIDALKGLTQTLIGVNGGKAQQVKPRPRPRTAFERARMRRQFSKHEQLVARVKAAQAAAAAEAQGGTVE